MGSQRRDDRRSDGPEQEPGSDASLRSSGLRPKQTSPVDRDELVGGQYRLLGPLGESSYGRAIRAEQVSSGREVALHLIPEGTVSERALQRELPLAIAKCALLSHPNIIALHGFGRVDGDRGPFYVVTDAVEGISLSEYLHKQGRLEIGAALTLARQIGRALRAAHKQGIVHGDLRPANVRVIGEDDAPHVRVMGFGKIPAARLQDDLSTGVRGLSAPTYASPELLRGEPLDQRSDVYALGAILFRMISGQAPFLGATPAAVAQAHKYAPVPSLRALVGDTVSPELDALVMRSLGKSRTDRFPDVVSMMSAMRVLSLEDGDLLSREVSEVSGLSISGPMRVNSILPSIPSSEADNAESAPRPTSRDEPVARWPLLVLGGLAGVALLVLAWWQLLR